MLGLSRKQRQTIHSGREDVQLTAFGIRGGLVTIGITAPDDVLVWRGELDREATATAGTIERTRRPRVAR